ncbi:MAG: hypothetical protein GWO12_17090 [Gemmatimonadetes bacterium]|uniref:Peptidase M15A C-terminal domain-containing protein n=1 Tax=Candidatus Kutchimonas denitrificans TaxID=3056748 RepID=A0AAE4ZDP7_9BACT|nr:hypothetical protein [Candidatus Kutchimonas denitrificans]
MPLAVVEWHPAMLFAHEVVDRVYRKFTGEDAMLTAAQEDAHGEHSLHFGIEDDPRCRAADYADDGVDDRGAVLTETRARLGSEFDVVWEGDHLHVEYDPEP